MVNLIDTIAITDPMKITTGIDLLTIKIDGALWCGIVNGYLIGPYVFERNVDRDSYLELLRDRLPELLEDVDLETRQRMWLQQDGAALHFARIISKW